MSVWVSMIHVEARAWLWCLSISYSTSWPWDGVSHWTRSLFCHLDSLVSQLSRFLCLCPQLLWLLALAAMLTFSYGSLPFNIRSSCMQSSLSYLQSQLHVPVTSKLIPFSEIIGCQLTRRETCFINFPFEVEEYLYVCVQACMYICTYNLSGILGF